MRTMQRRTPGWISALALLAVTATQAQTVANTPQEREAIEVVKKWWEAWKTGNPHEMVSDDIVFQGLPTAPIEKGRDTFRKHVARLSVAKSITVPEAVAMGGTTGTIVLTKRLLTFSVDGKEVDAPVAALTIVKDGKITQWQDFPLTQLERGPDGQSNPSSGDLSSKAKKSPDSGAASTH